jgi:hypothetical protein
MYKLRRIIHLNSRIADDWIQCDIKIDNTEEFYVSDIDMIGLKYQSDSDYDYYDYDNVLHLDCTPDWLRNSIFDKPNESFIDNYQKHLNDKHYVSYYYTYEGDGDLDYE